MHPAFEKDRCRNEIADSTAKTETMNQRNGSGHRFLPFIFQYDQIYTSGDIPFERYRYQILSPGKRDLASCQSLYLYNSVEIISQTHF